MLMKTLLLIRHAKSDWNQDLPDFDRPLNKRGTKDAPMMAKRLLDQGISPQLFISSPANRALTTARAFAHVLHYPMQNIQEQPSIYEAHHLDLLQVVNAIPNNFHSAALFGHNPGISLFAHYLCADAYMDFPTAAILCLTFKTDNWAEISSDTAKLNWFSYPKLA